MKIIGKQEQQSSDPVSMLLGGMNPLSMIGGLGLFGGLGGGGGLLQGLFDEKNSGNGLGSLWSQLGIGGMLPKGLLATFRDASPIAGSVMGNMFLPGLGGMAGKAAGNLGSAMLFGTK